jgi:hypothetical protein
MKLPREAPTLTKLCIKSIALNINLWCQGVEEFHLERCRYLLTAFDEYTLPDHLALQILNALALRKKLTLSNFVMFLNSSLVQLDLHECGGYITDHFIRQVSIPFPSLAPSSRLLPHLTLLFFASRWPSEPSAFAGSTSRRASRSPTRRSSTSRVGCGVCSPWT